MTNASTETAMSLPIATQSAALAASKRLFFLDNLRVVLVMLVIAHHVAQPYGPTEGFWPIMETVRSDLLAPFFVVNRSFFMSLFFLISGYFTVLSFDSSGAQRFVKGRLQRLGLPVLGWAFLLMLPLQLFVFQSPALPIDVGHLWFLEHLLLFSLGYALWRVLTKGRLQARQAELNPPGPLSILALAFAVALVSGIVREWYPIDKWVYLFGLLKVAWSDVPRDLTFFILGLLAYRHGWMYKFPTRSGMAWLGVGIAAALFWYAYSWGLTGSVIPREGTLADVLRLLWEGLFCLAISIGLIVLFRERVNLGGRLAKAMGQAQYAVYIFHLPVVLICQLLLFRLPLPPLVKFSLATLAAIPLTFWFGSWVRKPLRL